MRVHNLNVGDFPVSDGGKVVRTYTSAGAIYEKTIIPIKRGEIRTGIVVYKFFAKESADRAWAPKSVWRLSFSDYKKKRYEFAREHDGGGSPFVYLPGSGGK
jgi:outer membrane protein assembly factor BamD (BamD/ComL family)